MKKLLFPVIALCAAGIAGVPSASHAAELQMPPAMPENDQGQFVLTAVNGTYSMPGGTAPVSVQTRSFVPAGSELLVGPTLRIKVGDTLKLKFDNNLSYSLENGDQWMSDTFPHGFDVLNIHYHGLHVTPISPGDNVLLNIYPDDTPQLGVDLCDVEVSGDVAHSHVCFRGEFDYSFQIPADHPSGTYWYHPHKHGAVALHLASGMAGALIIEDPVKGLESLPAVQAAAEKVIVLNEIQYRTNVAQPYPVDCLSNYAFMSSCIFNPAVVPFTTDPNLPTNSKLSVNGQFNPTITMRTNEAQLWRVVNATVGNTLPFCLVPVDSPAAERPTLFVLTADGVPLQRPIGDGPDLPFMMSAPIYDLSGPLAGLFAVNNELALVTAGQRLDLMVKAPAQPGKYALLQPSGSTEMDDLCQPVSSSSLPDGELVMYVDVVQSASEIAYNMAVPTQTQLNGLNTPASLVNAPDKPTSPTQDVAFGFSASGTYPISGGASVVNGEPFSLTAVQRTLTIGKTDLWAVQSQSDTHMFHIHINPFQITQRGTVPYSFPVWRDTALINCNSTGSSCSFNGGLSKQSKEALPNAPEVVSWLSQAVDFTGLMVLHCHNVDHEDNGMMQLLQIVDPNGPPPPPMNLPPGFKSNMGNHKH